jgi:hypothetical protein
VSSRYSALLEIYSGRGDYESAERYFERARAIRNSWGRIIFTLRLHSSSGDVAYGAGDYARANDVSAH